MGLKIIALLLNRRHGGSTKSLKMKRLRLTQRKKFNTKKKTKQKYFCDHENHGKNMHFLPIGEKYAFFRSLLVIFIIPVTATIVIVGSLSLGSFDRVQESVETERIVLLLLELNRSRPAGDSSVGSTELFVRNKPL